MSQRTRPVDRLAVAIGKCSKEASDYGKCIVADYQNVYKDKCLQQFMILRNCYVTAYKKR